jgi:hypothetical protein
VELEQRQSQPAEGLPMSFAKSFTKSGYVVIKSVIDEKDREFLCEYLLASLRRPRATKGDALVPGTPAVYCDVATETLLEKLRPGLERHIELDLDPTYSYARLYKHGDSLPKHTDRPACEISGTLCLCYDAEPWPIWLESNGKSVAICLYPGDMVAYRGTEVPHWRNVFQGQYLAQVFLHYVDRNGPYREWKFDKRPALRTGTVRA